jgi:hypothetical protein
MQFPSGSTLTTICCFKYRTYMNTVSIIDKLCMWLLQQQNVKRDVIEKKITATTNANANSTMNASIDVDGIGDSSAVDSAVDSSGSS